jgi:hypothetical protein
MEAILDDIRKLEEKIEKHHMKLRKTRDLRSIKIETPINENLQVNEDAEYKTPSSYLQTVESELKRRFKR